MEDEKTVILCSRKDIVEYLRESWTEFLDRFAASLLYSVTVRTADCSTGNRPVAREFAKIREQAIKTTVRLQFFAVS